MPADPRAARPAPAGQGAPGALGAELLPRAFLDRPSLAVAPDLLGCVLEHEAADGLVAVVLTEVEAYAGAADPASHAYRGRTARNGVMFGPAGYAYVYFTYGMHFCVNVVCMPPGTASAVLIRAGRVIAGEELARRRRTGASQSPASESPPDQSPASQSAASQSAASQRGAPVTGLRSEELRDERRGKEPDSAPRRRAGQAEQADRDLARGPARLCQALGIDRALDGADLCAPDSELRLRMADATVRSEKKNVICAGPRVGVREGAEVPWRFWLDGDRTVSAYRPYTRRQR